MGSGSSSGGGGGGSGTVDYPEYMKTRHEAWLTALSTLISNVTSGASPFASALPYDPSTEISSMWASACNFGALVDALDGSSDFVTSMAMAATRVDAISNDVAFVTPTPAAESEIAASVAAFKAIQDDIVDNETLPNFRAGLRDINAAMSSVFVLGQAHIEGMRDRDVAKYQGDLRYGAFIKADEIAAQVIIEENKINLQLELSRRTSILSASESILRQLIAKMELEKAVTHYSIEARRMGLVARKEEADQALSIDEMDAKWDLEAYQYGANMLAAIGGGTMQMNRQQPSTAQSMLGGALSGAATGAMIGAQSSNPYGVAIGAVIGAAAGLIAS